MKPGLDYLGGNNFQKAMIAAHPAGWAAGIFLRTFGDARKTVRKMALSGKFSEIVVHLAPFDRTHKYEIKKYKKQVIADAKWLEILAQDFPTVDFLLSPFCENTHTRQTLQALFLELKDIAPRCIMLNSTISGVIVPGVTTELHLSDSKKLPKKPIGEYTISFDGFGGDGSGNSPDCDVQAILQKYSDARHIRIWNFRFNGKYGWDDKTPLESRKYWPDERYIKGHAALMKTRQGQVTWNNMLYKNFAEDSPNDSKANKAMCVYPVSLQQLQVKDINGKVIDVMKRMAGDFTGKPKGARYYSSRYAFEIGDLAEKSSGSRLIKIHDSPFTDADLRSSFFR